MKIAQDTQRLSNLIKYEYDPATRHCRDQINAPLRDVKIGELIDDTGAIATDAANIAGIVVEDKPAALYGDATFMPVAVLARGIAGVSEVGLVLNGLDLDAVKAALLAKDIKVVETF